MGFGLLFIGYFTATLMSVNTFGAFFRLIGYVVTLAAAGRLSKYNRSFLYLEIAAALMTVISAALAVFDVTSFLYTEMLISSNPFGAFVTAAGYTEMILSLAFNIAMLFAMRSIAIETGEGRIAVGAVRNLVFVFAYYVIYAVGALPVSFNENLLKVLNVTAFLLYFVWIILNLVLIYTCYARICDENDVDMQRKPSRFAFVNKMRAASDERERRAAEERAEYRRQKKEKRQNKGK